MLKKLICFFYVVSFMCHFSLMASNQKNEGFNSIRCSPQLQSYFNKILKISEMRTLISKIQKEGTVSILANNQTAQCADQFGACWDMDRRIIYVGLGRSNTEGKIIGSIVFELHNAAANSKLEYFDYLAATRNIDRESYIKAIEYIEYENSLKASAITKIGIELGIFPGDAYLPTYRDFEEHYYYQQMSQHSYLFGKNYDQLANQ